MKAFARKIGMTHVYRENGQHTSVTVLELLPTKLCKVKGQDKEGYSGAVYGLFDIAKTARKSILNQYGDVKDGLVKVVEERLEDNTVHEGMKLGETVGIDKFNEGDSVNIVSTSKGKGFAGTVKRHGFNTGPKTHGSHNYRQPGSIGDTGPQRVVLGKKMAGHMGAIRKTFKNIEILRVEKDKNRIYLSGPVPGPNKTIVVVGKND